VTRGDIILIVGAVVITALLWATFRLIPGRTVSNIVAVVRVNGKEITRVPVNGSTMAQKTIKIPRGQAIIEYGQGKVRVLPLPSHVCPKGICWKTGWISTPGQSIVCVPNHMTITLEGAKTEIDSIVR